MNCPTITLAIPTYNRRAKLQRLLELIGEQAESLTGGHRLQVLVSNNCSTDDTRGFLGQFRARSFDFRVIHQPVNIGGCRHLERMYRESLTDYTWVFSDDDVPFPGAIERVVQTIKEHRPDVLRFSFVQPTGSAVRQFAYTEPVYLTTEKREIARIISIYPKVSSYVVKNEYVSPSDPVFHYAGGFGWVWLGWHYAVVHRSINPKAAVISEALAGCDEDEKNDWTRFGFSTWWEFPRAFLHPFAMTHAPELYKEHDLAMYRGWVHCYDLVQRGQLSHTYFGNSLHVKPPFRLRALLADWRLCWRWARGRIGKPWIYKLHGLLKQLTA
jgi:glycosyltransferase involved in cell wall biosynthesis